MRYAITGATGFIGRALTDRLIQSGTTVRILTRNAEKVRQLWPEYSPDIVEADLGAAPKNALTNFLNNVDVVFHCAGEIRNTESMPAVNRDGTLRLCQAAEGRIHRWIQLSSAGVYGSYRDGVVTEDAPLAPADLYEKTKALGDLHVMHTALAGGFTYTLVRPSIVFGPTMPNQSLFQLIKTVAHGYFFYIGDRKATANYIHVDNVVQGLLSASWSEKAENKVYLLSDCCILSDLVGTVAKQFGKSNRFPRLPEMPARLVARGCGRMPGFPLTESRVDALTSKAVYSIKKITDDLDYRHKIPTLEGIGQMTHVWQQRKAMRIALSNR